ncbi:MAG TPA: hypothetical protein VF718_03775 [Allosphingosinicella sp.]|jgi:hypothetical protein
MAGRTTRKVCGALAIGGFALLSVAAPAPALAQPAMVYEYAVKVVCGRMDRDSRPPVAQGVYATVVNVHNPGRLILTRRKVAVAGRGAPGPISGFETLVLERDQAFHVDCEMIQRQAGGVDSLDGFLVIQSSNHIDVVAVYTTGKDEVTNFHTERVPERRVM